MTDEQLRAAYARAMAERATGGRTGCPTPDALAALVQREGAEAARMATLDHTMSCAACRQDFELLRAIAAGERRPAGPTLHVLRWQRPLAIALAASLVLAVGLGPGRDWLGDRRTDTMRGEPAGVVALLPEAGAVIASDSIEFDWRPVARATRYTLELLTSSGMVRLSGTTTDTTLALAIPEDVIAGDYRWWVRATLPGGEQRSGARLLTLRRNQPGRDGGAAR